MHSTISSSSVLISQSRFYCSSSAVVILVLFYVVYLLSLLFDVNNNYFYHYISYRISSSAHFVVKYITVFTRTFLYLNNRRFLLILVSMSIMDRWQALLLFVHLLIAASSVSNAAVPIDPKGYILYCPCMGKCRPMFLCRISSDRTQNPMSIEPILHALQSA